MLIIGAAFNFTPLKTLHAFVTMPLVTIGFISLYLIVWFGLFWLLLCPDVFLRICGIALSAGGYVLCVYIHLIFEYYDGLPGVLKHLDTLSVIKTIEGAMPLI